jgi:hypothetical protein
MSQYFLIVNLDKKQFLDPDKFGDGLQMETLNFSLKALAFLLGTYQEGLWASNRIAIVGEYAFSVEGLDRQNFGDPDYNEGETPYQIVYNYFEDISFRVLESMKHQKLSEA